MLHWHWEKIETPSRRRGLIAKTPVGIFRIVPNDFLPLDDLMAGRRVMADSYEVHLLRRGQQARVLGKNITMLASAKDLANWHFERQCT